MRVASSASNRVLTNPRTCSPRLSPLRLAPSLHLVPYLGVLQVFQIVKNVGMKVAVRVEFRVRSSLDQPVPHDVEHGLSQQERAQRDGQLGTARPRRAAAAPSPTSKWTDGIRKSRSLPWNGY